MATVPPPQLPPALSLRRRMLRWLVIVSLATIPLYIFQLPSLISSYGWNLAPVRGTLLLEGEPVVGAKVLLVPLSREIFTGELSPVSVGRTDPNGAFDLKTIGGARGAVSGRHLVFITTMERADSGVTQRLDVIPAEYNTASQKSVYVTPFFGVDNLKFDLKLQQIPPQNPRNE